MTGKQFFYYRKMLASMSLFCIFGALLFGTAPWNGPMFVPEDVADAAEAVLGAGSSGIPNLPISTKAFEALPRDFARKFEDPKI